MYLSAASAWEIAREAFARPSAAAVDAGALCARAARGARHRLALPIDEESALHVARLPSSIATRSIACWQARPSCTV